MPYPFPADPARIFRDAVAALSARLTSDYGDLVPDASTERTAALLAKLEEGETAGARGIRLADDHVATLDAWIRLADNAVLHDDSREASARTLIADQLRAVRALAAPRHHVLMPDERRGDWGGE